MIFVGDDWAEDHHDIYVCDDTGARLAQRRLPEGIHGMASLHELLAGYTEEPPEVAVGIETDRGLWVQALVTAGYHVYGINPKAASRYRDRHSLSGAKSDTADAKMLAELVRTDRHNHRQVAGDSDLAEGIKVLARAHQNLIWDRTRTANRLRAGLLEYFPAAVATFENLTDRDAVAILARVATPAAAKALSLNQIRTTLRNGGRQRNIDQKARAIAEGLRTNTLQAPGPITEAFAATTRSAVAILVELNRQITALETDLAHHFEQHPDADIYLSLPGIGVILGARVLGEFGDNPNRYANPKSRRNYAGTSPITRASGKHRAIHARYIRNHRLADALDRWAISALTTSPGARAYYNHHRTHGNTHNKTLRALANRLTGILHGCLHHHTPYNEHTAWNHRKTIDHTTAA